MRPSCLFPRGDGSPGEDEDYGGDVERPPHEEGQGSSTAPHRGQPGEADEQDGAQTEDHAQHGQGAHMDVQILCGDFRKRIKEDSKSLS